ncbi:exodeoxyribonuclease V subunit alpha [Conexibacter sp. SYSU D00693]|uniref:exodeoxyribonuclease V subunit alpha n=1 Tax=Conexibacter sp. SYSU D00693 TaxID=2812560 RepID=UPI00196B50FE|nr:exodeoxyribonuclease V subunit alpha [Conexibacter sp. SYSU D00693]
MTAPVHEDPFDVRLVRGATGLLEAFNAAGVLVAADVHGATRLLRLAGEDDERVALAAALAVRAPRAGHVFADLADVGATTVVDTDEPVDVAALPWPATDGWVAAVAQSGLVAVGEDDDPGRAARPLRLVGTRLYLDRTWREERQIAADLQRLAATAPAAVDEALLRDGLARLFTDDRQAQAGATAVRQGLAVVAGGPGTGKTTTVARVLALLVEQAAAAGGTPPLIGLAAPTGKAAARLQEAVHQAAAELPVAGAVRERLLALDAVTLHRLLGWRPDSRSRFRHHRANRLPYDVVVVDETSMVSLSLMARLAEAVRGGARLVLVGDPGQLTSVEAGAVLGDVVGPAATGAPAGGVMGQRVVVLERVHRFGEEIGALAEAIRRGDADATVDLLRAGGEAVTWIADDAGAPEDPAALDGVRRLVVDAGRAVHTAAHAGDAVGALAALGAVRVLCAHRRGAHGVAQWTARIEGWLTAEVEGFSARRRWYPGRPVLVTENDHEQRLYNGDTGVAVARPGGRLRVAFERRGEVVLVSPTRLRAVDSLHAMTIHKSQGSQVGTAVVLLPDAGSRILTRELLYTAVTRAQDRLVLAGTEEVVRAAVERPVARASGLGERLWRLS